MKKRFKKIIIGLYLVFVLFLTIFLPLFHHYFATLGISQTIEIQFDGSIFGDDYPAENIRYRIFLDDVQQGGEFFTDASGLITLYPAGTMGSWTIIYNWNFEGIHVDLGYGNVSTYNLIELLPHEFEGEFHWDILSQSYPLVTNSPVSIYYYDGIGWHVAGYETTDGYGMATFSLTSGMWSFNSIGLDNFTIDVWSVSPTSDIVYIEPIIIFVSIIIFIVLILWKTVVITIFYRLGLGKEPNRFITINRSFRTRSRKKANDLSPSSPLHIVFNSHSQTKTIRSNRFSRIELIPGFLSFSIVSFLEKLNLTTNFKKRI